jgi:asparagine synthase (glutamine-hydrolysing)
MPGIVGLITKLPREKAEAELLQMVESLRHEDFYVTGTWMDENLGIYVGWVARKNSFCDGMPLHNERNDIVLVFSGEEFPAPGTARHLKQRGHEFKVEGPFYLVHSYEEDLAFPAGLNGRFHGIVTDRRRGRTTLFNDRYGMHRIYYHESRSSFYFAAEAKAILSVRPELRRADARGLGELVTCGCVLENRTVFNDVHVLPPAAAWILEGGAVKRKSSYFQPREWEDQVPLQPGPYYEEFRRIFSQNLPRYFDGRQRLGMSLTGGLDSRMIMAWQRRPPGSLPCYTFGKQSGIRQCRDAVIAREVASACAQSHEVIPVGQEFFAKFPYYAERTVYLSDGCVDLTHSPDLFLNERARLVAPVRMTGNYGSEVLRLSRAFKPAQLTRGLFSQEFLPHIDAAGQTYATLRRGHPVSFAVFRQAPWHHYGLLALEETQLTLRSPYLDNDLVRTVFRAPQSALATNDICLRFIGEGDAALRGISTDRGLNGVPGGFSATMQQRFLEFLFKAEYAYDSGMPQWLAQIDHLLSPLHLERLFLGWHKFHHFRIWYRGILSGYVREILLDPRSLSRPYIDRRRLETVVEGHLKGHRNYTIEIHKVLTLELLHRVFLDPR